MTHPMIDTVNTLNIRGVIIVHLLHQLGVQVCRVSFHYITSLNRGRSDTSYRRASRSPPRRRASSPFRGRAQSRPRSPPPSSPPPAKRLKLGNHSITTSPRSRSPSRRAWDRVAPIKPVKDAKHPHDEQNLNPTPPRASPSRTPKQLDDHTLPELVTIIKDNQSMHVIQQPTDAPQPRIPTPPPIKPDPMELPATDASETPGENKTGPRQLEDSLRAAETSEVDTKLRNRSPSPPKHPRYRGGAPSRGALHRRASRSPPRGPRNHPRSSMAPTAPASFHPSGPRADRRLYSSTAGSNVNPQTALAASPATETSHAPLPEPDTSVPLPDIPRYKAPLSVTQDLDNEVCLLCYLTGYELTGVADCTPPRTSSPSSS